MIEILKQISSYILKNEKIIGHYVQKMKYF